MIEGVVDCKTSYGQADEEHQIRPEGVGLAVLWLGLLGVLQHRERALTVLKYAKKTEPKYGKPNSFGAYLMLLVGLAIAGLTVYYALNHKEQITQLWYRATHPDSVSVPVHPDQ